MTGIEEENMAPDTAQEPSAEWLKYRQSAVLKFLKNVVVIDNEPKFKNDGNSNAQAEIIEPDDLSLVDPLTDNTSPENSAIKPADPVDANSLDIREMSDAFADRGIACAFVLPDDDNKEEKAEEEIVGRVLKAAQFADMLVIDWFLRGKLPALTIKILQEIARADFKEKGRLRLICIYTGQLLEKPIFDAAQKALTDGGIEITPFGDINFVAKGPNCLLIVVSKSECPPLKLPDRLIEVFGVLADGILPSFALAAVGAIRKNVHHMVTRFSEDLDAAYVANRLIANPPTDVAELIRELFVTECDNALGLEEVADNFLEVGQIGLWMDERKAPLSDQSYTAKDSETGGKTEIDLNRNFLNQLLQEGIVSDKVKSAGKNISFPEKKRDLVALSLAKNDDQAKEAEKKFARLVALRREAFGNTKLTDGSKWKPSLTTGSLLKIKGQHKFDASYFICLTPACDTLRLSGVRRFVFIGNDPSAKKTNLVINDEDGKTKCLFFDHKSPNLVTFSFTADVDKKRVQALESWILDTRSPIYTFNTARELDHEFVWLGEVHYPRITSDVAQMVGNWMRIGISDSEYLRLAAKGDLSF